MTGNAKSLLMTRAPIASTIVAPRMTKPQKVKKWAMPGAFHLSSFFCPNTSTSWPLTRSPIWSVRPSAGRPERMSLTSQAIRRPATAAVISSIASARTIRRAPGAVYSQSNTFPYATGCGLMLKALSSEGCRCESVESIRLLPAGNHSGRLCGRSHPGEGSEADHEGVTVTDQFRALSVTRGSMVVGYRAMANPFYCAARTTGHPGGRRLSELSSPARVVSSTRAVERALALLAEVSAGGLMTLSDCARRTGLAPSTALRLLRTLESSGFVARTAAGLYSPGNRLIQLGALALGRQSLVNQVRPSLQRIVERTGESTYFVITGTGDTAIYLAMVEGTHAIRHTSWVGRAIALEDLAVASALRGDVPPEGYVAQRDRLEPDVTAIAAPIRWAGGITGALNLLGPTYRIDETTMHAYGAIVAREAATVGAHLGVDRAVRQAVLKEVP